MQREEKSKINITLNNNVILHLFPVGKKAKMYEISEEEAITHGECTVQLLEAKRYEYEFNNEDYQLLGNQDNGVTPSNSNPSRGIIFTGNYVGRLVLQIQGPTELMTYEVEVLATKFGDTNNFDQSYRQNYRKMLEDITEKASELVMQSNALVNQYFEPDFSVKNKTLYQKFSFIKAIINNPEFEESLLKIFSAPKTTWRDKEEQTDIRQIKRFTNRNIKEMMRGSNRTPLPSQHTLYKNLQLKSVANKIPSTKQEASLDNPENRFIKYALQHYLQFCENCKIAFKTGKYDYNEASALAQTLENYLNHSFFTTISKPTTLKLNSPTLQRKSGYRQILKSWIMFDIAAKLSWTGGDDVYNAGKKDIATLYEYWLFFVLYDLFKSKFELDETKHNSEDYQHLFKTTEFGLDLILKQGQHTALKGNTTIKNRALTIQFSFNRTFSGHKNSHPAAGSWTTNMRPDYTLSVWPQAITASQAEKQEQIVHIHFDAKYKVNHFEIASKAVDETLTPEEQQQLAKTKIEERGGKVKNVDLYKMHTYKDAIRRTGGAYILYPGTTSSQFKGFHELIPGLGAFSLNPATAENDTEELSAFIDEVINHLVNRTSQRENIATKTYDITKNGSSKSLFEPIPEYIDQNKTEKLIPDETYVIVGYIKNNQRQKRLNWYKDNGIYNFRMNDEDGALNFTEREASAKYLLLRGASEKDGPKIFKLKKGIKVYSGTALEAMGHPDAKKDAYLVVEFEKNIPKGFQNMKFNFENTPEYKRLISTTKNKYKLAGTPFTTRLSDLFS